MMKQALVCSALMLAACDSGVSSSGTPDDKIAAPVDVCGLVTQEEVDALFQESAGPGRQDTSNPHMQGCLWPGEGAPRLMLQVMRAPTDLRSSIDPGEGYRVSDVAGLGGPAAVAIQQAKPQFGIKEGVAVFAIVKGDRMLVLSPVRLEIADASPRYELLQQLAVAAAQRL